MITPEVAAATIALCRSLRIPIDGDRLSNLVRRQRRERSGVAVIGLANRGKSTLVNQLAGAAICPVGVLAKPATTVAVSRGQPRARGRTTGGWSDLPTESEQFRNLLSSSSPPFIEAEYVNALRLPGRLELIDTPGLRDDVLSTGPESLNRRWSAAGASAAMVVLSVPGGFSLTDRTLIDAAHELYGRSVGVVLKATDSSVTLDDLRATSEHLSLSHGLKAMVVDPHVDESGWGLGRLLDIEREFERLARLGEESGAGDTAEIESLIGDAVEAILQAPDERLTLLLGAASSALDEVAPAVRNAIRSRVQHLQFKRDERNAAAALAEHERQIQLLDDMARRISINLPRSLDEAGAELTSTYQELMRLASEGSDVATLALRPALMADERDRRRVDISGTELLKSVPSSAWATTLSDVTIRGADLIDFARLTLRTSGQQRSGMTTVLVRSCRAASARELEELLREVEGTSLTAVLWDPFVDRVIKEFEMAIADIDVDRDRFDTLRTRQTKANELSNRDNADDSTRVRVSRLGRSASDGASAALFRTQAAMTSGPVFDGEAWRSTHRLAQEISVWAESVASSPQSSLMRSNFASDGVLDQWFKLSASRVRQAQADADQIRRRWRTAYQLSFAGWAASVLAISSSLGAAFVLWIASMATWLAARSRWQLAPPWTPFYSCPSILQARAGEAGRSTPLLPPRAPAGEVGDLAAARRRQSTPLVGALLLVACGLGAIAFSVASSDSDDDAGRDVETTVPLSRESAPASSTRDVAVPGTTPTPSRSPTTPRPTTESTTESTTASTSTAVTTLPDVATAPPVSVAPSTSLTSNARCDQLTTRFALPLTLCDEGDGVFILQRLLQERGYSLEADGQFGPETLRAVADFQADSGLAADGQVGMATWRAAADGFTLPGTDLNNDGVVTPDEFD